MGNSVLFRPSFWMRLRILFGEPLLAYVWIENGQLNTYIGFQEDWGKPMKTIQTRVDVR